MVADSLSQVKAKIKRTKVHHCNSRDMDSGGPMRMRVVVRIMRWPLFLYSSAESDRLLHGEWMEHPIEPWECPREAKVS